MTSFTPRRPALVAGAFSILFTSHAFALNRYFPSPPTDDLDNNTIDYNIGTFTNVIVGYELTSDQANQNNTPFAYAVPYATTLTITTGAVINAPVEVFNGSTVNVLTGTVESIFPSFNPLTGAPVSTTDSATINFSGGTITSGIYSYAAGDVINVTGGQINQQGVFAYNGGTINVSGGFMPYVVGRNGATVNITGGEIQDVAINGQASSGTIGVNAFVSAVSAGAEDVSDTGGSLTLDGAAVTSAQAVGTGVLAMDDESLDTGDASATDNATLDIGSAEIRGNLNISGNATGGWNQVQVGGSLLMSGGMLLGSDTSTFGGSISLSGASSANIKSGDIGEVVNVGGTSSLILDSCSVDNNQNASDAVTAADSAKVTITGGSVITGECLANNGASITISGAIINGNLYAVNGGTITMAGGLVSGTAQADFDGTIAYSGGIIAGGVSQDDLLAGSLHPDDITGSLNLESTGGAILIYGTDLEATLIDDDYDGGQYSEYALTGTLADGTEVQGATFLVQNDSGGTYQLLPPVPEPASLGLLTGLAVLLHPRRRR